MASRLLFLAAASLPAYRSQQQASNNEMEEQEAPRQAICILNSDGGSNAKGLVHFAQTGMFSRTQITGEFSGLNPHQAHGFHIH